MKTLHIIVSPRGERSKSKLLGEYVSSKLSSEIEVLDLNSIEIPFLTANVIAYNYGFFKFEDLSPKEQSIATLQDKFIDQIKSADNIVISTPLWNFDMPAILKAYFDLIMKVGVAFKTTEQGFEGLILGKKTYLVLSKGGFYVGKPWASIDMIEQTVKQSVNFIGLTDVKVFSLEGTSYLKDNDLESSIERLKQEIDKNI